MNHVHTTFRNHPASFITLIPGPTLARFATSLQLIFALAATMRLIPLAQPRLHPSQFPLVSSSNEIGLSRDIKNPITVPMMPAARDQHLILPAHMRVIMAMQTHISPDIASAVDQRETRSGEVEVAVAVVPG